MQASAPNFERTFADLAYAHLREKAPKLLDFMVGFQVLEKNDDETQAAGVFGFELGKQWFYAPVFFLNGELKGHELLYIKKQDAFVPMQENWVNYLINRKPVVLGAGSPYTEADFATSRPDFQVYSRSPLRGSFSKLAGADYDPNRADERYGYWCDGTRFDITPALRCFTTLLNGPTHKAAATRMDLREVLKAGGPKAAAVILKSVRTNPAFGEALGAFYNPAELFPELAKRAEARMVKAAVPKAPEKEKKADTVVLEQVRVVRRGAPDEPEMENMTDNERAELLRDGYTVMDQRDPKSRSDVYDNAALNCLTNPDGSGIYNVLVKPAEFERCLIVYNPKTIGRGTANCATLVRLSNGRYENTGIKDLFVDGTPKAGDWEDFYSGLSDAGSMAAGNAYIVLSPGKVGSLPFTVVEKDGDKLLVHSADNVSRQPCGCDYWRSDPLAPNVTHDSTSISLDDTPRAADNVENELQWQRHSVRPVVIVDRLDHMQQMGNTLMVPRGLKVLKLGAIRSGNLGVELGNINDAEQAIRKQAGLSDIEVQYDGPWYTLKLANATVRHLRAADLVEQLVCNYGTSADDAKYMLKRASVNHGKSQRYLIKFAMAAGPLTVGAPAGPSPSLVDNQSMYDAALGVPTQISEPITETVGMPMGPEELYDPMTIDPAIQRAAQGAAQSDQKDVLDTSVLSGLVKAMDVNSFTDKYLADIMLGMDRIGRILFMFYWHNDKFEDRYGDDELRELEDALKNTFKSTGDLVLFLKKKTIEPEISAQGSDVDLDEVG